MRRLADGLGFTEGPVVSASGGFIVTSMDQGTVYRIREGGGAEPVAETGGRPNGAAEAGGNLYIAQAGIPVPDGNASEQLGGVQIMRPDGSVEWLTRGLVSPNDLCFGPDGFLYVTDPSRPRRRNDGRLWRVDPESGESELLFAGNWFPNGIGFGPENDAVYVASTNSAQILRFPLEERGVGRPEVVIDMDRGLPDGFAFDRDANLVIGAISPSEPPGEIQTWSLGGQILDTFRPGAGALYTNVALDAHGRLLVTASDEGAVLLLRGRYLPAMPLHPFRS